jgi:hypothetical protein
VRTLELTMVKAALVDRILGLRFSVLGVGGGRAATCGEAASFESCVPSGSTTGVDSGSDEGDRGTQSCWVCCGDRKADIIARRVNTVEDGEGTYGGWMKSAACLRRET